MANSDGAHIFPPRAGDQRVIDAIASQGGPFGFGIDGDFRQALGLHLGFTAEEILNISSDDMWKRYLDSEGLVNAAEPFCLELAAGGFPDVTGWVFDAAYQYSAQAVANCRYTPDGSRVYARTNTNQSTDFIRYNTPDYSVPFVPVNDSSPTSGQAFPNDGTEGFDFSSDGTKVYISRSGGNAMREYINNGTPYKFQTGDLSLNFTLGGVNRAFDVSVRGNGLQMFYVDSSNQLVRSITMTSPNDLSTGAVDAASFDPSNETGSKGTLDVSPDAVSMYLPAPAADVIYEYEFGTPGDVATITYTGRSLNVASILPVGTTVIGVSVSPDQQHMVCMARDPLVASNNYVMHFTRAPETDPDFNDVVLLLDFAGSDGGTDITDLSNSAHNETFADNAQIDTAETFLGENSLLLDGINDHISYPDSTDWDFGTGDFTVELGLRRNAGTTMCIGGNFDNVSDGWLLQYSGGNTLRWYNFSQILLGVVTLTAGQWYHVAIVRQGTTTKLFVDGVELDSQTDSSDYSGSSNPLILGALPSDTTQQEWDGSIGGVRITKGVARYTSNFIPPTSFYPTS